LDSGFYWDITDWANAELESSKIVQQNKLEKIKSPTISNVVNTMLHDSINSSNEFINNLFKKENLSSNFSPIYSKNYKGMSV
jgi:hypothetical protein